MRSRTLLIFVAALNAATQGARGASTVRANPFSFLEPTIRISDDERKQLDKREVLIRVLPAKDHEMAVFAAGSLAIGPERFIASVKDVVQLKKSQMVPQIG